jgi:hypothetical protein
MRCRAEQSLCLLLGLLVMGCQSERGYRWRSTFFPAAATRSRVQSGPMSPGHSTDHVVPKAPPSAGDDSNSSVPPAPHPATAPETAPAFDPASELPTPPPAPRLQGKSAGTPVQTPARHSPEPPGLLSPLDVRSIYDRWRPPAEEASPPAKPAQPEGKIADRRWRGLSLHQVGAEGHSQPVTLGTPESDSARHADHPLADVTLPSETAPITQVAPSAFRHPLRAESHGRGRE